MHDKKLRKRERYKPFDKAFFEEYAPHTLKAIDAGYSKTFKKWVVLTNSISEPDMALAYPELKKKYGRKFNDRMLNWMKGSGVPLEDIKTFITNKERDYAVWITIRSTRSVVAEWKKIRQLAIERVFQYFPVAVIVNGQTAILVYFQSFEE